MREKISGIIQIKEAIEKLRERNKRADNEKTAAILGYFEAPSFAFA
jgi:hypothetical protein